MFPAGRRKRVCLFGTSGDPPTAHGGHETIVRALASLTITPSSEEPLFDQIWVLPVYQHMYSEKRQKQTSFHHRLEMCRLAFQSIPRVVVSNLEQVCYDQYTQATGNTRGFGTVDLLDILLPQEPDTDFYLALGADTFMDLTSGKWKRAKEIIHRIQGRMVVFQRWVDATGILNQVQTQPLVSEPQLRERIHQVQDSLQDPAMEGMESRDRIGSDLLRFPLWIHIPNLSAVSSSLARSMDREDSLGRIVSSQVLSYVKEQALYTFAMETEGQ